MRIVLVCLALCAISGLIAQSAAVRVEDISIAGNERTRDYIILRELNLSVGDTIIIADSSQVLQQNKNQLLNTGLFADADLFFATDAVTATTRLHVKVKENLFAFPYAFVDLIDRDFNVWWKVHNFALERTLPYVGFKHLNLTGQQDELSLAFQVGFTDKVNFQNTFIRKVQVAYTSPYINRAQTMQLTGGFFFTRDRIVRLNTINNRDTFITSEETSLLERTLGRVGWSYRPQLFESHTLELTFRDRHVAEQIINQNEAYFGHPDQDRQRFLSLEYRFVSDRRDFQLMAKRGYYFEGGIAKEGFGWWNERNALLLDAEYAHYFTLSPKWSLETVGSIRTNLLRSDIDYYNLPVVGPKPEVVRGYITYHVRGSDFVYGKSSFRYELWNNQLNLGFLPSSVGQYRDLPLAVYLKVNNDMAYVRTIDAEPTNSLSNRLLYGGGGGIDLVIANTFRLELMLNTNSLGDRRFSFHTYFPF
ncbi:MAG: POTRA domain-containing protein [Bacteroidota bacterium]